MIIMLTNSRELQEKLTIVLATWGSKQFVCFLDQDSTAAAFNVAAAHHASTEDGFLAFMCLGRVWRWFFVARHILSEVTAAVELYRFHSITHPHNTRVTTNLAKILEA